ncbi:DNA repair protein XRCC3 isoform X2 [Oncorhynchus masou masou]|uniref:DNA repair protein XRCC3 isoform X2 n=1 Tax=Oncorhynchus masou masou TaxID=90313 RepID=UPI00318447D1
MVCMGNMDWEQLELNPRIIAAVKKANVKSAREILSLSGPDLQRLTHLSKSDVQHLHTAVAISYRRHSPVTGAVYICTEDSFPIKRLRQLITQQARLRPELPQALIRSIRFSDNIYIEHAADLGALQACVSQRVPILLSRGLVRLVVVDSVAALFRSEFQADEGIERARHMLAFAATLHRLSHNYSTPVLCINQVTDVMDGPDPAHCNFGLVDNKVLPALGMAWANQVMVRLMLLRLPGCVGTGEQGGTSALRRLEVVFAPHLPRASCLCGVWEEGVRGLPNRPRSVTNSVTKRLETTGELGLNDGT